MKTEITTLRQRTGAGVMDAERALVEAGGDLAQAEQIVRERQWDRPSTRPATAGVIFCGTHKGRIGAMVEIRCQTDFVARTEEFQAFGHEIVMQIIGGDPADVPALLAQDCLRPEYDEQGNVKPKKTVRQLLQEISATTGETVEVARFARYEANG